MANVRVGSWAEQLKVSTTSKLSSPTADIEAVIDIRRCGPASEVRSHTGREHTCRMTQMRPFTKNVT
jgi:hypothetical protein